MEDNRIQNQIAIYMTNKKLCEFTDKLKPAPVEYYAHMHAQGEEQSDGFRAYSCIGVVLQDYSNGKGDKTVRVTANLSPGFFPFVLSRMQNDLDRFDFTEEKIFGDPDENGLSTVTKLSIKRASVGNDGRVELAEEAKVEDYSLLLISMPKIEQDTEFTPDRLQSALQDNDRTEWVFSRLEEQWKQKYYAVAVSPPEHGTGNLCPISFGKYKGKYSARWIDCAHCHFNVAQPPCCLCVAGAGIQKKEDFKRDLQDRLFDIDKIRRTNEEEIRLREERERSFERRSVYPRPTPYAARPVVPAGPTQEELDAEYIRICQSYDPSSEEWTVDRYNRRWIMCTVCGRIKQDAQMSYYGGKGGANRGVCADCSRNGRS